MCAIVGHVDDFLHDTQQPSTRDERAFDLDLRADQRVQQRGQRLQCLFAEGQVTEQFCQRCLAGQADSADSAFLVENRQAFQEIVDLIEAHRQIHGRARRDVAGMAELRQAGR